MYIKTLELNPSDFFAQYNLGNIHLNRVIEDHKVVQDIVDAKEYNAALDKGYGEIRSCNSLFRKSIGIKS